MRASGDPARLEIRRLCSTRAAASWDRPALRRRQPKNAADQTIERQATRPPSDDGERHRRPSDMHRPSVGNGQLDDESHEQEAQRGTGDEREPEPRRVRPRREAARPPVVGRQEAEERASKVGVKLIFPIFFFILPTMLLVTAGPAVIQIAKHLGPALRGGH